MYTHGFATLALAECYGMYRNEKIATGLKKAVELILSAQKRNPRGGWRYSPDATTSDSSIAGCQIVALYAARNAGIPVPDTALEKGMKFMRKCRGSDGGYGYQNAMGDRPTLTAIGVLCESLAKQHKTKLYEASTKYLCEKSSTTVKATTPTILNIIWLRPFSTQMKKLGSNGMPKTPDTLELFKEQMDHSQEAAEIIQYFRSTSITRFELSFSSHLRKIEASFLLNRFSFPAVFFILRNCCQGRRNSLWTQVSPKMR